MFKNKPGGNAEPARSLGADRNSATGAVDAFGKSNDRPNSSAEAGTASLSLIGDDLTITGNIVSQGEIQVDGNIQGDIQCASLVVGEDAQIKGSVVADDVVVRGRIIGTIRGQRLSLQNSCHVEADISHKSLVIEQGAFFEGKSRRANDASDETPRDVSKPVPQPSSSRVFGTVQPTGGQQVPPSKTAD
jgi:cytoskeletal protein CcmA (bactofilin family)